MTHQAETKNRGLKLFNYVGEIYNELKKVVWLTRQQAIYMTGLVLAATIVAALVLGAIDFGFTNLINKLFLGG